MDVVADLSSLVQCEDVNCVNFAVSQKISDVFSRNLSEHCPVVIILEEMLPREFSTKSLLVDFPPHLN